MKIYIASSWKNRDRCIEVTRELQKARHEVDCFCDDKAGRFTFHWSEIPDHNTLNAVSFLKDEKAQIAFREDRKWIDWCEMVLMILPCGKSAHLEAGYAKGQGKRLVILGDFPVGEFDVMYGFADALCTGMKDVFKYLLRAEWQAP